MRILQLIRYRVIVEAGEPVFLQGDKGDSFYIVLRGTVDIFIRDEETRDNVKVATLRSGKSFGELALVSSEPRSATVLAGGETELVFLTRADYLAVLSDVVSRWVKRSSKLPYSSSFVYPTLEFFRDEWFNHLCFFVSSCLPSPTRTHH